MFNSEHWKIKLVYIGIGSLFGCLCTIIGMLASPATAQRDKFGEIECTKLTLIDPLSGKITAELNTGAHGGKLELNGGNENRGAAQLYVDKNGGRLYIFSNAVVGDTHISTSVGTSADGTGTVSTWHKDGGWTFISATDNGGFVSIYGSKHDNILASMGVTNDGESGLVKASRYENGKQSGAVQMKVDEHGGQVDVFGKVDNKTRAAVGINEYGNGAVSTWDKNGYRQ